MRTDRLARSYLRRALERLHAAEGSMGRGAYPDVVRFSQECVEMSLKACMRCVGVEHPKSHDIGGLLPYTRDMFPDWFQKEIGSLSKISGDLASQRSASLYGLELGREGPEDIFGEGDADKALKSARSVFRLSERLLAELIGD